MEHLVVEGGGPLEGTIKIQGSKNGALPLLAATLLSDGRCTLSNVPDLADVRTLLEILSELGMSVDQRGPNTFSMRVEDEGKSVARYDLVSQMRASIYVLAPLLAKRGYAKVSLPGGCVIGLRPVDLHLKGLRALGAEIELDHGYIVARAPGGRLKGGKVFLGGAFGSSVGATANTLMAASLADGKSVIEGAACEPEVAELAHFLNRMGATITGIGTPRLVVTGVPSLRGARQAVIPDRIEAGTYMAAAAMTGGKITLEDVRLDHLGAVVDTMQKVGLEINEVDEETITVCRTGPIMPVRVTTLPYPSYPTDTQAQLVSVLAMAQGISVVTEKIYPDRFMHLAELNRMGAEVMKEGASAVIRGVPVLKGTDVMASDLRAGAALVIAGLAAEGFTRVHRVYHIDRGYERMEEKLNSLGAKIERVREKVSSKAA